MAPWRAVRISVRASRIAWSSVSRRTSLVFSAIRPAPSDKLTRRVCLLADNAVLGKTLRLAGVDAEAGERRPGVALGLSGEPSLRAREARRGRGAQHSPLRGEGAARPVVR